jgi:outer membrane murein-binding lipoprotein Lpp
MKTRYVLVALAIVASLGILLAGCSQSDREAEASSCSGSGDGISVTCEDKGDEMECVVTCSGAEGSSEYVVTCEGHDGSSECTMTCEGDKDEMVCTVTCEGVERSKEFTITCDGQTVTCKHADGEKCTCTPATVSGCPSMAKMAEAGGASPGMTEAVDFGSSCAKSLGGSCPSSRSTEGS